MKRAELRRRKRQEVVAMDRSAQKANLNSAPKDTELLDMLDEGMLRLRPMDREALALRFIQGHPYQQVAESLGLSEEAARKRVERGLEKLRQFFHDRGIDTESTALAAVLAGGSGAPPVTESLVRRIADAATRAPQAAPILLLSPQVMIGWAVWVNVPHQPSLNVPLPVNTSVPDAAATSAPNTSPRALDLSTPDAALAEFCHALERADAATVNACLLSERNQGKTGLLASLDEELARRRMILAGERRWGVDANSLMDPSQGEMAAPILEAVIVLRRLEGDKASIAGDTANMTIKIPDEILESFPAGVRATLLPWSGSILYFRFRDGGWRIDIKRSVHYVMLVYRPGQHARNPGEFQAVAIIEALSAEYDKVAANIDAGRYPHLNDALRASNQIVGRVCVQFGISGINSYPAPGR